MGTHRWRRIRVASPMAALALAVGSAGGACRPHTHIIRNALTPSSGPQECPHYFVWVADTGGAVGPDTLRQIPSSGPITDVPEYHDCQKFIVADDHGRLYYDNIYAIYASIGLPRLDEVIDSMQALSAPGDTAGVVAATIVSYEGTYERLGIEPGFNCLYLSRVGGEWGAWMVPKGNAEATCDPQPAINDIAKVKRLVTSDVTPLPPLTADDVPAVARWDWDAGEREQYIGVRCGGGWCQVGDDASATQPPIVGTPVFGDIDGMEGNASREVARVTNVKGWQDAQVLAVSLADGRIVPSGAWGVITPHPSLHRHTMDVYSEKWVHVATAMVSTTYKGRVLTLRPLAQNDIYLCMAPEGKRPTEACTMPDPGPNCGSTTASSAQPDTTWWIRIDHWAPTTVHHEYHCVMRRTPQSPDYGKIPGTARWRWLAADETTWTRCEHGCCENQ